jgi:CubicO group peptidase (beta-lactamase class C family)/uncharacterized protein (DUF302 family)
MSSARQGEELQIVVPRAMRVLSILFAVAVLGAAPGLAQTAGDSGRGKAALTVRGKYIDQRVAEFMERHDVPGLTMAIVQAPYIPRSAGYGRASLEHDELASTRTMWNVGPLTQGFTAVAVFQLHEAGKLDVRQPVSKYLPDLPAAWSTITVFELLQHASGIPDYRTGPGFEAAQPLGPADLVALVKDRPLLFEPGTEVRQSATNFALLGLVIERASGLSFRDFVWRHQIEPLGLRATMFAEDFAARAALDRPAGGPGKPGDKQHSRFKAEPPFINPVEPAVGYRAVDGKRVAMPPRASQGLFAFASLWSSAEDISVWDVGLAGGILVKREDSRALIYKPTTLRNGTTVPAMAGWEFTRHPGFMEIKGSAPGFSAYLSRFTAPADLVCVTLLANKEGLDLTGLARDIAEAYKADLGPGLATDAIVTRESKFSVDETQARLEAELAARKIPVFARFDHDANARQAGLALRPTRVVVFGNPAVGTKLMQDSQPVALDLPLRLSIWQDARGRVWVAHQALEAMAAEFSISDRATLRAMTTGLDDLVARVVDVYRY